MRRVMLTAVLSLAALCTIAPGAYAAGGGGGEGGSGGKATDSDYTAGVAAIKAEEYAKAIPLFERSIARDGKNADAYNWLAYATRKNGDPKASIPIYEKALAIDPNHRGAHEYIGEAYLMVGDLPSAKRHLATLDSLCLFPCSEYRDLKKAVESYEKKAGK